MEETLHCLDQCQNKKDGLKYWTIVGQMCPSYAISKRHPVNVYKLIVGFIVGRKYQRWEVKNFSTTNCVREHFFTLRNLKEQP